LLIIIEEYEKKLKSAGVQCELHLFEGAVHGFCSMIGLTTFLFRMAVIAKVDIVAVEMAEWILNHFRTVESSSPTNCI